MHTVTIIGAGNLGTTLGMLFRAHGYAIHEIHSRTHASAEQARQVIGAGTVVAALDLLSPADFVVISTGDDSLGTIADQIARTALPRRNTIFFHCSGSRPASILSPLHQNDCLVASVHPLKTFTSPQSDSASFDGTWCAIDGDEAAIAILRPLFDDFGAKTFLVDPNRKLIYHAASVFISNYCVSLIEVALRCYEEAGVPRCVAAEAIGPIVRETVANALRAGPVAALTGPIARGDVGVVRTELAVLDAFRPQYRMLYEMLGSIAMELATEKGAVSTAKLDALRDALRYERYANACLSEPTRIPPGHS